MCGRTSSKGNTAAKGILPTSTSKTNPGHRIHSNQNIWLGWAHGVGWHCFEFLHCRVLFPQYLFSRQGKNQCRERGKTHFSHLWTKVPQDGNPLVTYLTYTRRTRKEAPVSWVTLDFCNPHLTKELTDSSHHLWSAGYWMGMTGSHVRVLKKSQQ